MILTRLKIKGYKNVDIDISNDQGILTFIGLNGSGKSNILEALSYIFKDFYISGINSFKQKAKKIAFDFVVEYEFDSNKFRIKKKGEDIDSNLHDISSLPKKIISIYSGEEERLNEGCYQQVFRGFKNNIKNGVISNALDMLMLNKEHWGISLLSLLLSNDNQGFIHDVLGIKHVNQIKFSFNNKRYKTFDYSTTKAFIDLIDYKEQYSLEELKALLKEYYNEIDIYNYLYNALISNMIADIQIVFNADNLTLNDLSEGEKKLLLLKAAFEFAAQEDSLFLLDEPDAHIHLDRKQQLIELIDKYKHNRQIILTTHSPTLTQCIKSMGNCDQSLHILKNGKTINSSMVKDIDYLVGEFWSAQQQTVFLSSEKKMILLVEGKHDKEHILNAWQYYKNDYQGLDFDVFDIGGESNLTPMLIGLREAKINNKKYIAIFDNDEAGRSNFTKKKYKKVDKSDYATLNPNGVDKGASNNFIGLLLPKKSGYNHDDFTIENMFDCDRYKEAYIKAVNEQKYEGFSIDAISKNVTNNAKRNLSQMSKSFQKDDFMHFKKLFDILQEINTLDADVKTNKEMTKNPREPIDIKDNKNDQLITVYVNSKPRNRERVRVEAIFDKGRGKIKLDDEEWYSPSTAAYNIGFKSSNGWTLWKDGDGNPIDKYR